MADATLNVDPEYNSLPQGQEGIEDENPLLTMETEEEISRDLQQTNAMVGGDTTVIDEGLSVPERDTIYEDPSPMTEMINKGITSIVTEEPMVNELDEDFRRKAREEEKEYQQQVINWQRESDRKIHETIQNFDTFEPDEDEEVRELKVIRSLLALDGVSEPVDAFDLEVKSALYAKRHFRADIESPRELFQLAKGRSDRRKIAEDEDTQMQSFALLGS